mgnify:FL=1
MTDLAPLLQYYGVSGNIGSVVATGTAIGTGTTKTRLNGDTVVQLPEKIQNLVGAVPWLTHSAPDPDEGTIVKYAIESDDFSPNPFEFMVSSGSHLGAIGSNKTSKEEFWAMNAKLNGGEKVSVYGTAGSAIGSNAKAGTALWVSDSPPTKPEIFGKLGTYTINTTAAGKAAGSNISLTGAQTLLEVFGSITPGISVITADIEAAGYFEIVSSDWTPNLPARWGADPNHAVEATSGEVFSNITRLPCSRTLAGRGTTILEDSFVVETTLTTQEVDFQIGARYLK